MKIIYLTSLTEQDAKGVKNGKGKVTSVREIAIRRNNVEPRGAGLKQRG